MARNFPLTTALYAPSIPSIDTDLGLTLCVWLNASSAGMSKPLCIGSLSGQKSIWLSTLISTCYLIVDGSSQQSASVNGAFSPNTWQHLAGVLTWSGTTNDYRKLYVDGGAYTDEDTVSTTIANTDLTEIDLNRSIDASGYSYSSNAINAAEAAIWNTTLTADEIAALCASGVGGDPRLVRPDSLVFYARLLNNDGDVDWWGQAGLSQIGSPSYGTSHPEMITSSGIWLPYQIGPRPSAVTALLDVEMRRQDVLEVVGDEREIEIGNHRQGSILRLTVSEYTITLDSSITTPGFLYIYNSSATAGDYVAVGYAAGTYLHRVYGGEAVLIPLAVGVSAIYLLASTSLTIEWEITERYEVT